MFKNVILFTFYLYDNLYERFKCSFNVLIIYLCCFIISSVIEFYLTLYPVKNNKLH